MANQPFYITIPQLAAMEAQFADAPQLWSKAKASALEKAAIQTQAVVMTQVPVRKGVLRKAIRYVIKGDIAIVYVDSSIKYAQAIEYGSGMFGQKGSPIEVNSKRVMATKINPGWGKPNAANYYIIGTYQRGQEANPFMQRSHDKARPIVRATFKEAAQLMNGQLAVK